MKTAVIRSTWMDGYGYRLDTSPYLGGALETKVLLEKLPLRKDPLHILTAGFDGGIYNGPKFSRTWVESPEYGVPFVGSSAMLYADLSDLPLLSKKQAHGRQLSHLELQAGMSLISCSGTIGKMVYARPDMAGIWSSQHILKVVADPAKIPSGYLYAYLGSKFGVPLIVSGTYGSIIQSLGPDNIKDLPVPRLGDALEHEIHSLVEEAAALRVAATAQIRGARKKVLEEFGKPPAPKFGARHRNSAGHPIQSDRVSQTSRLDAFYFNPVASELDEWVMRHPAGSEALGNIANVFDVPPFKHIYVGSNEGPGFFTSADIFLIDKKPDKYLSRSQTKGLSKYILEAGWVLLARSGSLGGNIARPQFSDSAMAGAAASDHVIRIAATSDSFSPGFLYAYLSLAELGYPLILRTATGACIPALWPTYLNHLRILRPTRRLNDEIDAQVREAFEMRVRATKIEDASRSSLETAVEQTALD